MVNSKEKIINLAIEYLNKCLDDPTVDINIESSNMFQPDSLVGYSEVTIKMSKTICRDSII